MDRALIACVLVMAACGPAPQPVGTARPDPTKEAWYTNAVDELVSLGKQAEALRTRQPDESSALILRAQPIVSQVLGVPRPTLAAMEAASDIDDLYGRMLMANRHYGSARMLFQKNVARWTHWKPQTEETARRRKDAEAAIAECDRRIAQ